MKHLRLLYFTLIDGNRSIYMLKRKRSYSSINDSDISNIHETGYVILKNSFEVDDEVVNYLKKSVEARSNIIFNHDKHRRRNDYKRSQKTLNMRNKLVGNLIDDLKSNLTQNISTELHAKDWVVIYSKAGCQKQAAHCDYIPSQDFIKCPKRLMPLEAVFAITDDSTIDVWPKSIGLSNGLTTTSRIIKRKTLKLKKGDIFVFRGDLVHAGSSYDKDNIRLHAYLDSPIVPRFPNKTWIVHEHGSTDIKKCIEA